MLSEKIYRQFNEVILSQMDFYYKKKYMKKTKSFISKT